MSWGISGIVWRAIKAVRQSITICLVNYCWHILADSSISPLCWRQWRNRIFLFPMSKMRGLSRQRTMIPPESFGAWFIFNEIINLHDFSLATSNRSLNRSSCWWIIIKIIPLYETLFLSDIMTHLFHLKLFVSPEVILIKYFYISTEIFSCHYDMMNYCAHKFCCSHWWLYFLSPQAKDKRRARERKTFQREALCCVIKHFFQTSFHIQKSWRIGRRQHEKSFHEFETFFFIFDKWNNWSPSCIYFASCLSFPGHPHLREHQKHIQHIKGDSSTSKYRREAFSFVEIVCLVNY